MGARTQRHADSGRHHTEEHQHGAGEANVRERGWWGDPIWRARWPGRLGWETGAGLGELALEARDLLGLGRARGAFAFELHVQRLGAGERSVVIIAVRHPTRSQRYHPT